MRSWTRHLSLIVFFLTVIFGPLTTFAPRLADPKRKAGVELKSAAEGIRSTAAPASAANNSPTLGYSRKAVRLLSFRSSSRI